MTAFPCFAHCGKAACHKLGCVRVYNDSHCSHGIATKDHCRECALAGFCGCRECRDAA